MLAHASPAVGTVWPQCSSRHHLLLQPAHVSCAGIHAPCARVISVCAAAAASTRAVTRRIAAAIREAGLQGQAHPLDYLQFFCLAKRESNDQYSGGVSQGLRNLLRRRIS